MGCARCLPVAIMDMVALGWASSGYGYVLGGRGVLLQEFLSMSGMGLSAASVPAEQGLS